MGSFVRKYDFSPTIVSIFSGEKARKIEVIFTAALFLETSTFVSGGADTHLRRRRFFLSFVSQYSK